MPKHLNLWTDGGARGNPGPAAAGIVIRDGEVVVYEDGLFLGSNLTNNQAEYRALQHGLRHLKQLGAITVDCYLDSQLVVEQLRGRYRIKDAGLRQLWEEARTLLGEFSSWEVHHIPREQNRRADALVNQALDAEQR